jgi:acetolactate synthase-1/3 small subunit
MLLKVRATGRSARRSSAASDIFRGQIIDITSTLYTVRTGRHRQKLDAFIAALGEAQILEVARTGVSGIARGEKILAL